jgi:prepilin-type N-terminal cleavage/methylation domain-containing protein
MLNREDRVAARSHSPFPIPHFLFPHSPFPISSRGLTLIELLVTIAILVTVLGAVVPMVSPNNDARKIREASRQLNGMLSQAQAQAARDGRAVGVAFREFGTASPYSGMALEAYFIAEPPAFAGFSPNSRAVVTLAGSRYTDQSGHQVKYRKFLGRRLCQIRLAILDNKGNWNDDPFPPGVVRIGDTLKAAGNEFLIVEEDYPDAVSSSLNVLDPNLPSTMKFLASSPNLLCVWTNDNDQPLAGPPVITELPRKPYVISRQPRKSSDAPLQFPTGVGIDLAASGATGPNTRSDLDGGGPDVVGILFAPNGTLNALYFDEQLNGSVQDVYIHLGRFENGNNGSQNPNDYNFLDYPAASASELAERRARLNWLNPDSRWVAVNRAGRIITAENNIFDPQTDGFLTGIKGQDPDERAREQRIKQIRTARDLAEKMTSEGGR